MKINHPNNHLDYIFETIQIYAKNFVFNTPTWNRPLLLKKVREKALREAEDLNIKLSKEDLEIIEELSLRGLQGRMEDATYFEDNTD